MKFRVIGVTLVCIGLIFVGLTGQSIAAIDPNTIVGLWMFDDGSGDIAEDSSGNGFDGTLINGPAWVNGKFGKALEFDGTGPHVKTTAHESPTEAITVSAWAKSATETWNVQGWLAEKRNAYIMHPVVGTRDMAWCFSNGTPWNLPHSWDTGAVGPDDITEWHMYTGTYDSATGEWKIYIDGEVASELDLNPDPIIEHAGPMHIGSDGGGGRFGAGAVDEVFVLSVALGADDIEAIYENGFEMAMAVGAAGKLVTTWADVKTQY